MTPTGAATAVSIFHPVLDTVGFDHWLTGVLAGARTVTGFVSARVSVHNEPGLDWAAEVTFAAEEQAHAWLDSKMRVGQLRDGAAEGYLRCATDLVIVEGRQAPEGVDGFAHSVAPGREAEFEATQRRLNAACAQLPGFEGTALFPPDAGDQWLSLVRFRTAEQLSAWLRSAERQVALGALRSSLTAEFTPLTSTTPFATTVRTEHGRTLMTPNWKSAMMVMLVLYPTVMLLSRFVGPVFDRYGAEPWLALWLSQVLSVSLMQWWLMPWATRPFRRWLDPVDGRGTRISMIGAGAILACYGGTLVVFALVQWLQFWDYNT
ncbi:MAG: antibiotic biosynthesis monooxygenase [Mycobacterium sp.]